jgi:hypothetical protein
MIPLLTEDAWRLLGTHGRGLQAGCRKGGGRGLRILFLGLFFEHISVLLLAPAGEIY